MDNWIAMQINVSYGLIYIKCINENKNIYDTADYCNSFFWCNFKTRLFRILLKIIICPGFIITLIRFIYYKLQINFGGVLLCFGFLFVCFGFFKWWMNEKRKLSSTTDYHISNITVTYYSFAILISEDS